MTASPAQPLPPGLAQPATLRRLHAIDDAALEDLSQLLVAVVQAGSSVGFMAPLPLSRARAFWQGVDAAVRAGERALLVAEQPQAEGRRIVGTVQLLLAQPDNQPHRADLAKMQVLPSCQQQGLGTALLQQAEQLALACGKSLLVLDTASGSPAERLYTRQGWLRVGEVPDYALWPQGGLCATTYFYKKLRG